LEKLGMTLEPRIIPFLEAQRYEELDSLVKELGKKIDVRITIVDSEGLVLADSEKDPQKMENHRDRPEIREAFRGETGKSMRYSITMKENMLYVALPMEKDGKIVGVLRESLFLKQIHNLLNKLKTRVFFISLFIVIFSVLGALFISRTLCLPIKKLSKASETLASGNFDVRVFLKNKDELRELADNFNYMAEKIKETFTDLNLQKEELRSVISSIQEGLMVIEKSSRITRVNESIKKIIHAEEIEGKLYWEILTLKSVKLSDLIKKAMEMKMSIKEEVEIDGKIYLCGITYVVAKDEIIVILYDITELKKYEEMKRDFVANVSHELRTPLTAIYGYLETLEEDAKDIQKDYVQIIKKHTQRLTNIVQDLLILSELEQKRKIEFEYVKLKKIVENVLTIYERKAIEKGLKLKLKIEDSIDKIKGDSFQLEQLLINLIDNAIKYTEKDGIEILASKEKDFVKLEVRDTGIGIPEKDLPRIFERFYVVDKSRSRKLGGTGLGLSIVKHIVMLHNGKIDVKSTQGKGTIFTIWLPIS
jgi:two-component system phosphate regulon sensor histidine kinase PhoR